MTTRIRHWILPTLLLLAVGGPARALVVDDFEGGAFSYSGKREVYVQSNLVDQLADADLALTSTADDAVSLVLPTAGGVLELTYAPPAPFDLTLGGSATEIEVRMPLAWIPTLAD